jgi:hypothetical protein
MTTPNYAAEGRIREAAAAAGVRAECLEYVVMRFREGKLTENELPEQLAQWKSDPDHYYFAGSKADLDAEAIAAFGETRTLKAQADYLKKYGEAAANEMAARFETTVGHRNPGKTPSGYVKPKLDDETANLAKQHKGTNPFSADGWNISEQGRIYKSSPKLAESLAKSAGVKIGATRPARAA